MTKTVLLISITNKIYLLNFQSSNKCYHHQNFYHNYFSNLCLYHNYLTKIHHHHPNACCARKEIMSMMSTKNSSSVLLRRCMS